jgi:CheY-like chemotaxis protein
VEAHGGRIDATSPGKGLGTTVRVELPLMIVHDSLSDSAGRVHPSADVLASARDLNLADLAGIRVLLVDDDGDALQMAKDALMFAGASVVTAANARQALAALDENTFDVAVLDIGMPEVDGYQLLHQIRHRPDDRQGRLPAAALTAYARSIDRTRSLKGGFQMHLSKPVQPTELAAAVLTLSGKVRS